MLLLHVLFDGCIGIAKNTLDIEWQTDSNTLLCCSYNRYVCNEGYTPVGDESNFCVDDGTWNSTGAFKCDPVPCPDPGALANGIITNSLVGTLIFTFCPRR